MIVRLGLLSLLAAGLMVAPYALYKKYMVPDLNSLKALYSQADNYSSKLASQ